MSKHTVGTSITAMLGLAILGGCQPDAQIASKNLSKPACGIL